MSELNPPFIDLSWLWKALLDEFEKIKAWLEKLKDQLALVKDTGAGVAAGLFSLGGALWDAIVRAFEWIYKGLTEALSSFGKWLYDSIAAFGKWVWDTFAAIPGAIYSALQWIYNGIVWIGQQIYWILVSVWNYIMERINDILRYLESIYNAVVRSFNAFLSGLTANFRAKLKRIIVADTTIMMYFRSMKTLTKNFTLRGLIGFFTLPIGGYIGASLFAEMLDFILGKSTVDVKILGEIKVPEFKVPKLEVPMAPELAPPVGPAPPVIGVGLPYDLEYPLVYKLDTYVYSSDTSLGIDLKFETEINSSEAVIEKPPIEGKVESEIGTHVEVDTIQKLESGIKSQVEYKTESYDMELVPDLTYETIIPP